MERFINTRTKGHKMKDFLGHELREGDRVVTIVMTPTKSMEFVIAKIKYITRKRIQLESWETYDDALRKQFTTPDKCILIF